MLIEVKPNRGSSLQEVRDFVAKQLILISSNFHKLPEKSDLPPHLQKYASIVQDSIVLVNKKIDVHNQKTDVFFDQTSLLGKIRSIVYKILYFTRDLESIKNKFKIKHVFHAHRSIYKETHRFRQAIKKPKMIELMLLFRQDSPRKQERELALQDMLRFFKEKLDSTQQLSAEDVTTLLQIGHLLENQGILSKKSNGDLEITSPSASASMDIPLAPPTDVPIAPPTDLPVLSSGANALPVWKQKLKEKIHANSGGPSSSPLSPLSPQVSVMEQLKERLARRNLAMTGAASKTSPAATQSESPVEIEKDDGDWDGDV